MAQRDRLDLMASARTLRRATMVAPHQPKAAPVSAAVPATIPVIGWSSLGLEIRRSFGQRCPERGSCRRPRWSRMWAMRIVASGLVFFGLEQQIMAVLWPNYP